MGDYKLLFFDKYGEDLLAVYESAYRDVATQSMRMAISGAMVSSCTKHVKFESVEAKCYSVLPPLDTLELDLLFSSDDAPVMNNNLHLLPVNGKESVTITQNDEDIEEDV